MSEREIARRTFLHAATAATVAAPALFAADGPTTPRLKKAVKYGMIGEGNSVLEKFKLIKELGFEGVELDSPSGVNRDEAVKARDATGVVIHGVVDSVHWNIRLSDPDEAVRQKGLDALLGAIKDCKHYGGTTVLLVPGAVRDAQKETFQQVWDRSTEQVKKAIPLADELGVKIAIEVVWNDFLTNPDDFVKYIDQFSTPTVGGYFDISNMIKYRVPPATWIRKLGKRMLKFDFKGYHLEKQWVDIGEGSEDWPEVRKALREIGYHGWATAEVGGGGREHLKAVAAKMDKVLYD